MKKLLSKIKEFFKKLFKKDSDKDSQNDSIKFVSFGSPNCSYAVEDKRVQIKDLTWNPNKLSYKWASTTKLEQWGIMDPHSAKALACFGYLDQTGLWHFGKIDWISSDRLTRDMVNVREGYNGIKPEVYFAAKKHGFFIMEANGKRRSNILTV